MLYKIEQIINIVRCAGWEKECIGPGVQSGSTAWKAVMLTLIPPMHPCENSEILFLACCHGKTCQLSLIVSVDTHFIN